MNLTVILNWKSWAAIGLTALGMYIVSKMDSEAVAQVSIHAVDACKEVAVARNGNC